MTESRPDGYLAVPSVGAGMGILVLHAWWGLNGFFKSFCRRLASEGFVAFAPDLYHGKIASTVPEAEGLRSRLKQNEASADIDVALSYLGRQNGVTGRGVGVIGFSLGAYYALRLSADQGKNVRAVVIFYGTRGGDYAGSAAAYLGHFAETDAWVAPSGVKKLARALRAARRPATFYTYEGAGHWFFEDDRVDAYKEAAALLAWERTVAFLKDALVE